MVNLSLAEYKKLFKAKKPKGRAKRPDKVKKERVISEGEAVLSLQLRAHGIKFEREFRFHSTRRWRADFHIIGRQLLIEVEGGVWSAGRHTRAKGYLGDIEKYNEATALGYQIIRFETSQVTSGYAFRWIEKFLGLSQDKSL